MLASVGPQDSKWTCTYSTSPKKQTKADMSSAAFEFFLHAWLLYYGSKLWNAHSEQIFCLCMSFVFNLAQNLYECWVIVWQCQVKWCVTLQDLTSVQVIACCSRARRRNMCLVMHASSVLSGSSVSGCRASSMHAVCYQLICTRVQVLACIAECCHTIWLTFCLVQM